MEVHLGQVEVEGGSLEGAPRNKQAAQRSLGALTLRRPGVCSGEAVREEVEGVCWELPA